MLMSVGFIFYLHFDLDRKVRDINRDINIKLYENTCKESINKKDINREKILKKIKKSIKNYILDLDDEDIYFKEFNKRRVDLYDLYFHIEVDEKLLMIFEKLSKNVDILIDEVDLLIRIDDMELIRISITDHTFDLHDPHPLYQKFNRKLKD